MVGVNASSIISTSSLVALVTISSSFLTNSFSSLRIVVVLNFGGRNLLPFFENLEISKLFFGSEAFGEAGLNPNGSPFNLGLEAFGANNGDLLYSFSVVMDCGAGVLGLGLLSPG